MLDIFLRPQILNRQKTRIMGFKIELVMSQSFFCIRVSAIFPFANVSEQRKCVFSYYIIIKNACLSGRFIKCGGFPHLIFVVANLCYNKNMKLKNAFDQLNISKQCRQYNLSIWQCPNFLTIIMGIVTMIAMIGTYMIASRYSNEPEMAALTVIIVTIIVFIIGYFIVNSFNYLAEANRLKSEFVGIASHQLRTPLSALKWAMNILMDDPFLDKGKQREYLEIIKTSNERMIKLVNDLLDVSRIEQGRIDLKPEKFSLAKLTQEIIDEVRPLAQKNNIFLTLEVQENIGEAWADPSRIHLVLQNLLENAIKYTESGGMVKAILKNQGSYLRAEIADSGVGIPVAEQSRVFQKFFRSDNAKKNQVEGTGLGLFIVKAIAEMSKGKVGFESKEKQGSTFWFIIPIAKS